MKRYITNKYSLTILGIIAFFLLWYIIYLAAGKDIYIFPGPVEVIKEAFSYFGDSYLYKCMWESLYRMLIGFSAGAILGIALGMVIGNYTNVKYVFNPTIIALRSIPTAALVFLLLSLVGFANASLYIVIIIVFPMVYEATVSGYRHIDSYVLMAMKVDSHNSFTNNFKIMLPLSFPYIMVGLVSSFALSFKIELMAEVLTSSSESYGLGRAISVSFSQQTNGLISTFAYAFIAILLMLIVSLIIYIIKRNTKLKNLSD